MSSSLYKTWPELGIISLVISLRSVDLPAPEGPVIKTNSEPSIFKLISSRATWPSGNCLETDINSNIRQMFQLLLNLYFSNIHQPSNLGRAKSLSKYFNLFADVFI